VISVDPTVPNLILLPSTVPLIGVVPPASGRLMVPVSFDPDCCQCSVKVPLNDPLYWPFQVPESRALDFVAAAAGDAAAVDAGAEVEAAAGVAADAGEAVGLLAELQAASSSAAGTMTAGTMIGAILVRHMVGPPQKACLDAR
jgi:hypothetical protein